MMLEVEQEKENTYLEYRIGKMYQYGLGTEENLSEAANVIKLSVYSVKLNNSSNFYNFL